MVVKKKKKVDKLRKRPIKVRKKKKIGLFYKISFSILLSLSLVLSYFIVLVSAKPKSIPYITSKIELHLKKRFGNDISLDDGRVRFTAYGSLVVAVDNLKISHINNDQEILIPRIEGEFSLLDILSGNLNPNKIKFINPEIIVDNPYGVKKIPVGQEGILDSSSQSELLFTIFSWIRQGKLPIKNFEIENAKLIIRDEKIQKDILLKKAKILTSIQKDKIIHISSSNIISFSKDKNDVDLSTNCQLNKYNDLKCDVFLENFIPNSISKIHPKLKFLDNINSSLNTGLSFLIEGAKMKNMVFSAKARGGNFYFPNFFSQKINISNLILKGEYDHELGILNLSKIKAGFEDENMPLNASPRKVPVVDMSLVISGIKNSQQNFNYKIKLSNVPSYDLDRYWPISLKSRGVRKWVISHIKDGIINDAYAEFSVLKKGLKSHLQTINSRMSFQGINLKYHDKFPVVNDINGEAKFTKKGMEIDITQGNFLNSKLTNGRVVIDDFRQSMLSISGQYLGDGGDSLRHINHKSKVANRQIKKYLNGNSQNNFEVKIPLNNSSLKNSYISINSVIAGLNNDYVRGGVMINSKKDFDSKDFVTNIDLTAARLRVNALGIKKKVGVLGNLDLTISVVSNRKIFLKNITLEKESKYQKGKSLRSSRSRISGDLWFLTSPFTILAAELENNNFGRNNYKISYKTSRKDSNRRLSITGQKIDLTSFIKYKAFGASHNKKYKNSHVQIAISNAHLFNKKQINSLYLSLTCENSFCHSGIAKANYDNKPLLSLVSNNKDLKKDFATIKGNIFNIGYIAEALGISRIVDGGRAKIDLNTKFINKRQVLEGELNIDNEITFYENAVFKKLASDDLFSQIKDKIFSNEKTTFDSLKLKFDIKDEMLNVKSLIANNYKIGITSKGFFNLKNNTYEFKGMVIPGFIINNLFGLGNIPILGNVISGLLTGGKGGGLFGIRYEYVKNRAKMEPKFKTNKVSAFVPTTIRNLFDAI